VQEVLQIAHRHRLRLPPDLLLLGKALVTIEGVGKSHDPEFNALEIAKPWATELIRRQLNPFEVGRRAVAKGREYLQLLGHLPGKIDRSLARLLPGGLQGRFLPDDLARAERS